MTYSTLTSKGRITIPLEIRKALDLKARQRLVCELKGDEVIPKAETGSVLAFCGCLKSDRPPPGKKAIREVVHRAVAENAVEEGRR